MLAAAELALERLAVFKGAGATPLIEPADEVEDAGLRVATPGGPIGR